MTYEHVVTFYASAYAEKKLSSIMIQKRPPIQRESPEHLASGRASIFAVVESDQGQVNKTFPNGCGLFTHIQFQYSSDHIILAPILCLAQCMRKVDVRSMFLLALAHCETWVVF